MFSFKSIYFVIFILNLYYSSAQISDKRLCVDSECKEPVSKAKTLLRYSSLDPKILSFNANEQVTIYSKEAGSMTNLWGAEIMGKRGYVPHRLVREYKVFKKPTVLVDTETASPKTQVPTIGDEKTEPVIEPDKVKEPYEVVDGTTIYLNPQNVLSDEESTTVVPQANSDKKADLVPNKVIEEPEKPKENIEKAKDNLEKPESSKDAPEEPTKIEESVVDNVLSSFSNWITDKGESEQTKSEEDFDLEEEDDLEDDDDWDEEDDEEEEEEKDFTKSTENNNSTQETTLKENLEKDINSLHKLPPDVKISPYNVEINNTDPSDGLEMEKKGFEKDGVDSNEVIEKVTTLSPETENPIEIPIPEADADAPTTTEAYLDQNSAEASTETESLTAPTETSVFGLNDSRNSIIEEKVPVNILNETKEEDNTLLKSTEVIPDNPETVEKPVKEENVEQPLAGEDTNKNVSEQVQATTSQEVPKENGLENDQPDVLKVERPNLDSQIKEQAEEKVVRSERQDVPLERPTLPPMGLFGSIPRIVKESDQNEIVQGENNAAENINGTDNLVNEKNGSNEDTQVGNVDSEEPSIEPINGGKVLSENQEEQISSDDSKEILKDSEETATENPFEFKEELNASDEVVPENLDYNSIIYESVNVDENKEEKLIENTNDISTESPEKENSSNELNSDIPLAEEVQKEESGGFFSGMFSSFWGGSEQTPEDSVPPELNRVEESLEENIWTRNHHEKEELKPVVDQCSIDDKYCTNNNSEKKSFVDEVSISLSSDVFVYLLTTAASVILFLFGYLALDKSRREAPLVARVNKLEQELLIVLKENEALQSGQGVSQDLVDSQDDHSNELIENLTQTLAESQLAKKQLMERITILERELEVKESLEEQVETLEKELETSTEVGMELNRIISEMLDPTNGSDKLKENVEQLQRQLLEQRETINTMNYNLSEKESENQKLLSQLDKTSNKARDAQTKLDEIMGKIVKIEKERDQQQDVLQNQLSVYHQKLVEASSKEVLLNDEIQSARVQLSDYQRQVELKTKEYQTLKDSLKNIKSIQNDEKVFKALLESSSIKAELLQLRDDNLKFVEELQQEKTLKLSYENKLKSFAEENELLKQRYESADKEKVEVNAKLEVLTNYFKKRESELQDEINKFRSIWDSKEGEAASTTERIKYMQEEIENYKSQNDILKQEIISQEIDLKSQISVLEKKVHENWVNSRQMERKLEDVRQEAAQLRNRLTFRERSLNENRLQSPVEQNGDLSLSPHLMDSPASPPLLYGARDHMTKSPPLSGLLPFLPPPPGAPFMPPPMPGMPPFMPPPPGLFPGDHRPPPLGRMSSPPLASRYSPDSSAFSPYERNSPSPPYDSEYGASPPPPVRGYGSYGRDRDDRRDYKRQDYKKTNGRSNKGSVMSSGSDRSNESLEKVNRKHSKLV